MERGGRGGGEEEVEGGGRVRQGIGFLQRLQGRVMTGDVSSGGTRWSWVPRRKDIVVPAVG
jgi:hypothetical protein